MIHRIRRAAKKKSVIGAVSLLVVTGTAFGAHFNKPVEPTRYVLAAASRDALMVSITGSGQVSGENQIDMKPNAAGKLTAVSVKAGETVKAGAVLFTIDNKDALKAVRDARQSVRDAQLSLESAQYSYSKLTEPPDEISLLQAQNNVSDAGKALADLKAPPDSIAVLEAEKTLEDQIESAKMSSDGTTPQIVRDAYDDSVPFLKSMTQDLEKILNDADGILGIDHPSSNDTYEILLSALDSSKKWIADTAYPGTKNSFTDLKNLTNTMPIKNADIGQITSAFQAAQETIDNLDDLLQKVQDALAYTPTSASFSQSSLNSLQSTIQSDRTSLSSKILSVSSQLATIDKAQTSYDDAQINVLKARAALDDLEAAPDSNALAKAEAHVLEMKATLEKLRGGTSALDLSISQNGVAQRQASLTAARSHLSDALEALNDYNVKAPFDGLIVSVPVNANDEVSANTILANLITEAKIVQLSLNEVDVSSVKVGQKATLTFDALPDLTIAGQVADVDVIGTVTQGVVNYSVKVALLTQDDQIKPGMSATASIVTDMRPDALAVPNSAVTQNGNGATVRVVADVSADTATASDGIVPPAPPEIRAVQVGLSNDQMTEIVSGLAEGEFVVTRTIDPATATAAQASQTQQSSLRIPNMSAGASMGGGATMRVFQGR
ncbi:MAG: efflux RND transporter periplasmic adaptor subunit [Patescibacteria group bacterium]